MRKKMINNYIQNMTSLPAKTKKTLVESDSESDSEEEKVEEVLEDEEDEEDDDDNIYEEEEEYMNEPIVTDGVDPEPTDSALLADIDTIPDQEEDKFLVSHDTLRIHTTPYLTKYEMTKVLALRAQQILTGAPPTVDSSLFKNNEYPIEPYSIAYMELKMSRLPLIIGRRLPNNTVIRIPVHALLIPE